MKLAVIFPGMGYHVDKPLLYYSKKIAKAYGYSIIDVPYGNFPKDAKKEDALQSAMEHTETMLQEVDFSQYEDLLFISKSIGTVVASAYAEKHSLNTRNVYYTPVEEAFRFRKQDGIVFHGTNDWVDTKIIKQECSKNGYPLYITKDGNHSLETGNVPEDLANLKEIMEITQRFCGGLQRGKLTPQIIDRTVKLL